METKYCLRDGVSYRPESFGGLLFVPHRSLVVELNRSAYSIIAAVDDGAATASLCEMCGPEHSEAIDAFLRKLEQSEIIAEVGR